MQSSIARTNRQHAGFTFVEILAAMLFLTILIPTVLGALAISNRASVVSERSATAMQLAESRLNELLAEGTWMMGATGGDFGQDWPGYRWEMTNQVWPEDSMSEVTVRVYFSVQGREQSIALTTVASEEQATSAMESTAPATTP